MTEGAPRRVLVTGARGFVGRHLLAFLGRLRAGPQVLALSRVRADPGPGPATWQSCDLLEDRQVGAILQAFRPDAIVHLAGRIEGPDLASFFADNVLASTVLLAQAARLEPRPRFLVIGSSAQYGAPVGPETRLTEDHPLNGRTPYAVSKTLQEQWALAHWAHLGLPVVAVRPFNLLGPGQSGNQVPAAFLRQVQACREGRASRVEVGNLSTRRDFIDVRDAVRGLWALLEADSSVLGQCFNLSSGRPVRIQDLLDACLDLGGGGIAVEYTDARRKHVDVPELAGDHARIRAHTGWTPATDWRRSLADMWRHLLAQGAP